MLSQCWDPYPLYADSGNLIPLTSTIPVQYKEIYCALFGHILISIVLTASYLFTYVKPVFRSGSILLSIHSLHLMYVLMFAICSLHLPYTLYVSRLCQIRFYYTRIGWPNIYVVSFVQICQDVLQLAGTIRPNIYIDLLPYLSVYVTASRYILAQHIRHLFCQICQDVLQLAGTQHVCHLLPVAF
jgi:hypothetical protein